MKRLPVLLLSIWILGSGATPQAAEWEMDAGASKLQFIATFEGAEAAGVFKNFDARLRLDTRQAQDNELRVKIAVASADMFSDDVNEAIADPEWFDVARYPTATFSAREICSNEPGRYTARGTLRLKGVEKHIELPFAWNPEGGSGVMEGSVTLNRLDFNIGTGEWSSPDPIGLDVVVRFSVQFRKVD